MAGRSLNPATHRRLGGPLPRLLPNGPRPHPRPPGLSPGGHAPSREYPVLAWLSPGYPGVGGRLVTCYSPVRHSTRTRGCFLVRLACVRHAASVHPEPGSNSPFEGGPVSRAPDQTDSVPVWKCCLSIRTAASEMRRIKINVKDRNDGSLSSDSHVSIRTTRWHITIYRLFTLCGQYPVLKVPAGPRPAAPPGWDQLPLRAARGSILRASPPPVNRILEIFSRARFRGPRPRPGRCGTENSTPAAGAGQGGSGERICLCWSIPDSSS